MRSWHHEALRRAQKHPSTTKNVHSIRQQQQQQRAGSQRLDPSGAKVTSVLHRPHPPSHLSHPPPLHTAIRYNKTKHAIANSIACCDVLVARKNPLQWPCRVPPPATKGFSAVWPPGRGTQSEAPPTLIVHHVKDLSLNCRYRGGEALTCSRRASRQAAGEADSTGTRCVRSQQGRPVASRRHGDGPPQAPGSVVHRGGVPRR